MLKQLMLSKKIEGLRKTLSEYLEEDVKLTTRGEELEGAIEEAETEEELEAVESEVEKLEEDKEDLKKKKDKLEKDIQELEDELEELKSKKPSNEGRERGKEDMEKRDLKSAIGKYVRTKQLRDDDVEGFKVVDGGVLVPEELLTPYRKPEDEIDLKKLVSVVKVNSGAGKYPIIKRASGKMVSVAELEKNPELAKPQIDDVAYNIATYRGYVPVSQEVVDDAAFDVTGLVAEGIADQERNTTNAAIATSLKGATALTVEGLDELKEVFNVKLKKVYTAKAVISASLYNTLDTLKDNNGRYLLQEDITVASGKRLFGREVVVLDDDVIGDTAGDLVGFIGDPKAFATFFDRKQASVKWIDHHVYGQLLAGYIRFDVQEVDGDAGFYVTFIPEEGN